MQQPGRESAAALSVVRVSASDRPQPPVYFNDEMAALWRSITATKPAEWFTDDSLPLLEAYCEGWFTHRTASAALRSYMPADWCLDDSRKAVRELEAMQRGSASSMAQLAQKMRLSQSARYGARGASGAHERTFKTAKPWET